MDPFEVRMQFLSLLKRLTASQQSIAKVVSYAMKYFPPCGEDIWDCIVEECQKGSINSRINILYFLDTLCETCRLVKFHAGSVGNDPGSQYVDYVARDLRKIVENVVPPGREGLPNLVTTKQILDTWRSKRIVDPHIIDNVVQTLDERSTITPVASTTKHSRPELPRSEVFKRIEEDRERHKRLRERRWVQPIVPNAYGIQPPLVSFQDGDAEDIEFENEWETLSDWNEDDDEACREENLLAGLTLIEHPDHEMHEF